MSSINLEVYDAFKEIGVSEEQARKAAAAIAHQDDLEKAIYQQTIKLGAMIFASAGLVVAAIKLWN
jgi:hypothetical protein